MSTDQVKYYRDQAATVYAEVQTLESQLKLTGVQHKRQALKAKIEAARLQWQVLNLHRENEELKLDALGKVMASQVQDLQSTLKTARKLSVELGRTAATRLRDLADELDSAVERERYEDISYALTNSLPNLMSNLRLDLLSKYRGEIMTAEYVLRLTGATKE